jgi:hypothetical protein
LRYVRILLAGMSNMLSSIVTAALAQAPDIVVVGRIGDDEDLASGIRLTSADAVILQTSDPGAGESFAPLLRSFPTLKVVAIDRTGSGFVQQLHPYSTRIAELSANALQSALRSGSSYFSAQK